MARIRPLLLFACLGCALPAVDLLEVTVPDLARTRDRFATSLYGRNWLRTEVAPLATLVQSYSTMASFAVGFDPLTLLRQADGAELRLQLGGPQQGPAVVAQLRCGEPMLGQVVAALARTGAPPWQAESGDGWLQLEDRLLLGRHVPELRSLPGGSGDDDLLIRLDPDGLLAYLMQSEGIPPEAIALLADLVPRGEFGVRLCERGLRQELRLAAPPAGLVGTGRALLDRLPATTWGASVTGIDGAAFWEAHRNSILGMAQLGLRRDDEAGTLAMLDQLVEPLGGGLGFEALIGDLRGDVLVALGGESALLPSLTIGLPRSPGLDALISNGFALLGQQAPAEGSFRFLVIPNPDRQGHRQPALIALGNSAIGRDAGHWWVGSDSLLVEDLVLGRSGGWSRDPAIAAALAAVPEDACIVGASDSQRLLRSLVPFAAIAGSFLEQPALVEAVTRFAHGLARDATVETIVGAPASEGFTVTVEGPLAGLSIGGGGQLPLVAIVAAIAIPNLLESRVTANEHAAATTLRTIHGSMVAFQAGGFNDIDGDNLGEYGFLAQLSGAEDCFPRLGGEHFRGRNGGADPGDSLTFLVREFDDAQTNVIAGYHFQVWLPAGENEMMDLAEARRRLAAGDTSWASGAEKFFVCYAWPAEFGESGRRVFAITQEGKLLTTAPGSVELPPAWNAVVGGRDATVREVCRTPDWQPMTR